MSDLAVFILVQLIIETMAIALRLNQNIRGIPIEESELKISLLVNDSTCFLDGSQGSFDNLFGTLIKFSNFSGHKIIFFLNLMLFGLVLKRGLKTFPFSDQGLTWKINHFKTLGIHFSLKIGSMFDLNYKTKLKKIDGVLNCWHTRNFSLISNICVIKTLLLPQLLYLFSVWCIKIPKSVLKLDKMFYKFIWNGGNDRVQRACIRNDYNDCGLCMIDPYHFS